MALRAERLDGKVAIVTGATKGIGLAIAERLGLEGAAVVISSRNAANVEEAVALLKKHGVKRAVGVPAHVAKKEDQEKIVQTALSEFGNIDILVNNAGINPVFGDIIDLDLQMWDKLFETNVKAGFALAKLCYPHIKRRGGGSIVFNASYGGYNPPLGIGAYAVTKTALLGLTKALAQNLARDNIRVNCIAPGVIKTKLSRALWDDGTSAGEQRVVDMQQIALGRLGEPQECAGAVAFLCSNDASYITGETIVIAGGIHARL